MRSYPQGHVFYRVMAHEYPLIERGEGVYLYDAEGRRYQAFGNVLRHRNFIVDRQIGQAQPYSKERDDQDSAHIGYRGPQGTCVRRWRPGFCPDE